VWRAWAAFAGRHGLDADEVNRLAHGRPSRETVRQLTPEHADRESLLIEEAETTDVDGVVALPGADALLRSGRRLAIVTSCSDALATVRLRAAGLPVPDVLVSADAVTRGKPDPEAFLLAAERLGVAPADCVVLEDAPAGIAAGRAAGCNVIALRTTHADAELAGADAIVDDLTALPIGVR
jgi:mannitol-1-/sugar-/sorbitol-6-phosphatase